MILPNLRIELTGNDSRLLAELLTQPERLDFIGKEIADELNVWNVIFSANGATHSVHYRPMEKYLVVE